MRWYNINGYCPVCGLNEKTNEEIKERIRKNEADIECYVSFHGIIRDDLIKENEKLKSKLIKGGANEKKR